MSKPVGRPKAKREEEPVKPAPRGRVRNPGLARLNQVQMVGTHSTGLEDDPEISQAIEEDDQTITSMDSEVDVDQVMDEALQDVANPSIKEYPIGNGTTVPYPDDGELTTDVATCTRHMPGVNRGCAFHTVRGKPFCPMGTGNPLAVKYGFSGPGNMVYKDLRSGRVKTCFCTSMMSTYLHMANIVLLPGPEWFPTRSADYKLLPNGQRPMPGPNQPRTPIVLTPHKTQLVCVPPEGLVKEFQQMRRRGEFMPKERRRRRGAR